MASSSAPGPSKRKNVEVTAAAPSRAPLKTLKVISKTIDLLKKNEGLKNKGKGKERAILGDIRGLIQGRFLIIIALNSSDRDVATKTLPGAIQVERFAEVRLASSDLGRLTHCRRREH